jgi:branched-chain amino acid transport system permease protein
MSVWRLVFFGALLMLTLRFRRNGLIHPVLLWFSRAGLTRATVVERDAAAADRAVKETGEPR